MPITEPGTESVIGKHLFLEYMNSHIALSQNLPGTAYSELATVYWSVPGPALCSFNSATSYKPHGSQVQCYYPIL